MERAHSALRAKQAHKRTVSAKHGASKVQEDLAAAEQSYKNLSYTTSQLSLLSQEVDTLTEEKKALQTMQVELKREITQTLHRAQTVKKNHEKLHNEAVKVHKATLKLEADRVLMEKELATLKTEVRELEADTGEAQAETQRLRRILEEEVQAAQKLERVTAKLRKEMNLQMRVRETLRKEAKTTAKQTKHMEEKVAQLSKANKQFMKRIDATVLHDTR